MQKILKSLHTINYWDKKPNFNLGYIRNTYLDKIKKAFDNKLIKVIVGQRRTGKSYITTAVLECIVLETKEQEVKLWIEKANSTYIWRKMQKV